MKRNRRDDAAVFAAFTAIGAAYFWEAFAGTRSPLIVADDHAVTFGRMAQKADWLRRGEIPLWNPRLFTGLSSIDVVPPVHLLHLQPWVMALFGDKPGYNLCNLAFVVFGAHGTYRLCRETFGISRPLSIAAGLSVAYGPFIGNTYSSIFTLFPFISYYARFLFEAGEADAAGRAFRAGLKSVFPAAACLYTQEPRFLEFIAYSSALFAATSLASRRGERRRLLRNLTAFAAPSAAGLLLAGLPLFAPLVLEVFGQRRLGAGFDPPPFFNPPPLRSLLNLALGTAFPLSAVDFQDGRRTKFFGDELTLWSAHVHVLFFAAAILCLAAYRSLRPLERSVVATAFLLEGLAHFWRYIPGLERLWTQTFKTGRFVEGDVSFFYLVIVVFLVLDRALRGEAGLPATLRRAASVVTGAQAAFATLAAAAILAALRSGVRLPAPWPVRPESVFLAAAYLLAALQLLLFRRLLLVGALSPALRGAFLGTLFVVPLLLSKGFWPMNREPDRFDRKTPDREFLSTLSVMDRVDNVVFQERYTLPPDLMRQTISVNSARSLHWTILAYPPAVVSCIHHFVRQDIFEYIDEMYRDDPHYTPGMRRWRVYLAPQDNALFHLLGVKYFFSELEIFKPPFRRIDKKGDFHVYVDDEAAPRLFFVDRVEVEPDLAAVRRRLKSMDAPTSRAVALVAEADAPAAGAPASFPSRHRAVEMIRYRPNRVEIRTESDGEQFLVFTDTYDPRWRAEIDGVEHPVVRTHAIFRGLRIPPGRHTIVFRYHYPEFWAYVGVAVVSLAVIAGLAFGGGRRR